MALALVAFGVVAICLLTAVSAFFSSSELAVFSVSSHRVDALAASDAPGAAALAELRADPHRFLVTALVSNNVANIAAASVATAVLVEFLPANQAATGATVATSFFVIVFGEIAPKSYAVANAERHALRVARPVAVVQRVLRPVLVVFEVATGLINRVTGGESNIETYLTRDEIETIVVGGESSGVLDPAEGSMIRRVLELDETTAKAVMVPRTEMIAVPDDATLTDAIETAWQHRVSRMPVYGDTRDDVTGVVDVRDLLRARSEDGTLADATREAVFVPETKPLDELLTELRRAGAELAVVVDEFGTVVGLVTFEDVIEEVVGEIFDSEELDPIQVVDAHTAVVNGLTTLNYVNERLGLALRTDGPYETVAGLVSHHTGRLTDEGDRVELGEVTFTVLDATQRRVRRVRIDWPPDAAGPQTASGRTADPARKDD